MSFAKSMLSPEEETELQQEIQREIEHHMSLEDAIQEYVRIDLRYQELAEEKRRCLEVLIPVALEVRGTTNTTRLQSHDGKIELKITFDTTDRIDKQRLETVREILGDDVFEDYFKIEYTAKRKTLKPFLASRSTDERIETAKTIIKEAVVPVPKSPSITIEKGRGEIQSFWEG